ncbi:hypothetical protein [Micromonospora sp. KC723]|uniref:hypothetical protein n=1 Tax=Micromonospora sp. KC723 TaxID=2530381 RepID=UPI001042D5A6|nr:hypothetical protein [Micromonospora sp. KC723]TDB70674.1 hypothetical protein E1165_25080 [Micromonospora sp. KC723]
MTDLKSLKRLRWAVRAVLALGVAASIAGNVLHAKDNLVSQIVSAWSPLALLWRRGVLHDLSLAGVSTAGTVVDLDDRGRIAASIRPVWGVSRAVVYHPRSFEGSAAPRPTASGYTARGAGR